MSLYNIDENKNMVLDALFAPYSDSPRDVTRITQSNALSLDILDWIDVFGDYSFQGVDSQTINCYMVDAGVYLVIKHHDAGATNGSASVDNILSTFLSTIYVDSTGVNNILPLTARAYAINGYGKWQWYSICYFRIIRLQ